MTANDPPPRFSQLQKMVMSVKYNVILVAILTAIQVMVQDTVVYSIRMVGGGGFYVLKMLDNNGYPQRMSI